MDQVVHKSVLTGPNGEIMFDMAEDASKSGQGNALYQKFIDTYPSHKLAKKALKELTKN